MSSSATAATACTPATGQVDPSAVAAAVKAVLAKLPTTVQVPGLDAPAVQVPGAQVIVATGITLKVPARGQVVALATALQESGLRNLAYGDRDSLGLFQQRPSQGWGTPAQIMDPVYASTQFYEHLLKVPGWQDLPVTVAAQQVQQSGFPDAYAKWEPLATALQQALTPTQASGPTPGPGTPSGTTVPSGATGCGAGGGVSFGPIPPGTVPAGYQIPAIASPTARTAIRWAMGQLGTPYQWGGSCQNAHGADPMGRCDCSSLVQQSYKAAGIPLPRTTYDQVNQGTPTTVAHLVPGDLLFTEGPPSAPGHVGIYMGDGLIINAPHTGAVVDINTLASWLPQIVAARHITG
nr:C40 family peptidase [Streptacidiphilus fuscans]